MTLIHNERTKLSATYFNGVAIAVFAVGGFAPLISAFGTATGPSTATGIVTVICVFISGALHFAARRLLKGLRE